MQKKDEKAYDNACKKIFMNKSVLAVLMRSIMKEYQNCSIDFIAQHCIEAHLLEERKGDEENRIIGARNEMNFPSFGKILQDITFFARFPNSKHLLDVMINLEIQMTHFTLEELYLRALFYGCSMIVSQKNTIFVKTEYKNMIKVHTIWLILYPETIKSTEVDVHLESKLNYGNEKALFSSELTDKLAMSMVYCWQGGTSEAEEMIEILFYRDLSSKAINQELKKKFGFKCDLIGEEMEELDSFSEAYKRFHDKKWKEEYRAEGLAEGKNQSLLTSIQAVMSSLNLSVDQAMDVLKIEESKKAMFRSMIL